MGTPERLSLDEAAQMIECSVTRLKRGLNLGRYPGLREGRHWVIPRNAFVQWMNDAALIEMRARVPRRGRRRPLANV